jgi:hypothetical protein
MQYWIDGDKIRFDNGVDSGYFTPEATSHYEAYLAWVAEGNTAEEWNPE